MTMTIAARAALTVVAAMLLIACGGGDSANVSTAGVPGDDRPGFGSVPSSQRATYEYTIPEGAGDALDAGEPLSILPGSLTVTVGETIRIVNEDTRGHSVGPWFVSAQATLRQEFTTPGSYEGVCSVHPSGEFVLEVLPR